MTRMCDTRSYFKKNYTMAEIEIHKYVSTIYIIQLQCLETEPRTFHVEHVHVCACTHTHQVHNLDLSYQLIMPLHVHCIVPQATPTDARTCYTIHRKL